MTPITLRPVALVIAGAAVLAVTGCATTTAAPTPSAGSNELEDMEPVTIRFADANPESGDSATYVKRWMDEVTERTDGKVTFETYFSATLVPPTEAIDALNSDIADMTFFNNGWWTEQLPVSNWEGGLTGLATSVGFPNANLVGAAVTMANLDTNEAIAEELAAFDARPLLPMYSSPFVLTCTSPIETLEDAQGKSVRTSGHPWQGEVGHLGMNNVFLPLIEQYEALQRGVIDCALNGSTQVPTLSLLDVAPYVSPLNAGSTTGAYYVISNSLWNELPTEVQEIMIDARAGALAGFVEATLDSFAKIADTAESSGGTFTDPSALNEALAEYREPLFDDMASAAPAAVRDAAAAVERIQEMTDDWESLVTDDLHMRAADVSNLDSVIAAWSAGSAGYDWDAYADALRTYTSSK
ncbi:MAG: hypothetical protein ABWY20_01475 [Mycobacterium sp.]